MAILDLYSKRRKRELGQMPDVYSYSEIPEQLRVQIIYIWRDAIGHPQSIHPASWVNNNYCLIVQVLRREYGVFTLVDGSQTWFYDELCQFFLKEQDVTKLIDVIELTFKVIGERNGAKADEAIKELNDRFKEHGIGYEYSNGIVIRKDSELIHREAVKPTLVILRQKGFENAEKEFLSAHKHYQTGKYSEALIDCCKAFESVMKIICTKRKWAFDSTKPASHLIDVCFKNGLIPTFWQNHFTGLRTILESAIPTPRNKKAGHGAGAQPAPEPSSELVAYVLHMTAATILFLTESERKIP